MANKWTDAVACLLDMKSVPKAVLGALAFHSDNESGQSWPSIRLICRETGYKETAVKSALKLLEANEFISKAGTKPAKFGEVNVWQINGVALQRGLNTTGSLYEPPPGRTTTGGRSTKGTGSSGDGEGVATRRRNSSRNSSCNSPDGTVPYGAGEQQDAQTGDGETKATSKPETPVPKIQGKISVKSDEPPAPIEITEEEGDFLDSLLKQWKFYKLPEIPRGIEHYVGWIELIRKYGETVSDVMAWMMFINKHQYWKKNCIHSVADFTRCFPKMHEQYEKCGGAELEKALEVAGKKYAEDQRMCSICGKRKPMPENAWCQECFDRRVAADSQGTFKVEPIEGENPARPRSFADLRLCANFLRDSSKCTAMGRLRVEPGQTLCPRCIEEVPEGGPFIDPDEDEDGQSFRVEDVEVSASDGLD